MHKTPVVHHAAAVRMIALAALLAACSSSSSSNSSPQSDPDAEVEARVQGLLAQMTLEEKFEQMAGNDSLLDLLDYGAGTHDTPDNVRLGIPGLKFTDGPRGVMLGESTCFPVGMARGAAWDPDLEERIGIAIGREARARGANLCGAPCINVLRHPGWGRAQETYGADPYAIGVLGSALVRGLQRSVMACPKHFAANSIENTRFHVDVTMDERTLREIYLPHFRRTVEAGAASVMSAYNKLDGSYCSENEHLLTGILKEDWGFQGFVISDFLLGVHSPEAVNAGLDVEMPVAFFFSKPALFLSVLSGSVPASGIDQAVARILRQKVSFGLLDGWEPADPAWVACPEHRELAREAARKGIVLLKNERAALPLDLRAGDRIAVLGRLAGEVNLGDTGSSIVTPPYAVTPLEGILRRARQSSIEVDFYGGSDPAGIEAAASGADAAVLVVGLTSADEGEFIPIFGSSGGDRESLGLGQAREELVRAATRANERCIVVLEGGSAIAVGSWMDEAEAIVMAWYPGMEGGHALAEILFGDESPSGKLPLTFPRSDDQLYPFGCDADSIVYDYDHDYRYFDRQGLAPAFCFGHGLSYTTFAYSRLRLDRSRVSSRDTIVLHADLTNTGAAAGAEVVQLYIGYPESRVLRPLRELKGFARVELQPGETRTVTIEVSPRDLAYYDSGAEGWVIESTRYEAHLGASSRDLRLSGAVEIVD
ncbi:MAG: glycoside hydrolase family 3 C-terminal domain-containing protein [bacterium]